MPKFNGDTEYELMQEQFSAFLADKKFDPDMPDQLRALLEVAFCNGWMLAMDRYTGLTSNIAVQRLREMVDKH